MENNIIKILAIDDNRDNLISLKAIISEVLPQSVVYMELSGQGGIRSARKNEPDVILLDIVMPGMDGYEVCKILKADEQLSETPVVFLTALKGDKQSRILALEAGGDAFLAKPVDSTDLKAQILAMLKINEAVAYKRNEKLRLEELVQKRTEELKNANIAALNLLEDLNTENEIRKQHERDLKKSEEKFRNIFQNHAAVKLILDAENLNIVDANHAAADFYGWPVETLQKMNMFQINTLQPDDLKKELEIVRKQKSNLFEFIHRKADGSLSHVEVFSSCIKIGDKEFLHSIIHDISEKKKAEENLRLSERNLLDAERIGNTGSWYYNLETGLAEWSESLYHIFDVDKELQTDLVFKNYIENIIHPDDRLAVDNVYSEIFAAERLIDIEFRIFRMDGEIRFIRMRAESKSDQTGKVIQVIGRVEDTTKSKQAEEVIQKKNEELAVQNEELNETNNELIAAKKMAEESEAKSRALFEILKQERILLRTIIDSIPDSIYVKDLEYRKVLANKANCQNCGVDKEEDIIGRTDFDIFPAEIAEKLLEDDKKVCEDGVSVINKEEYIKRPNFDEKCLLTTKLPLYDDKGKIIGLVGIGHDITERKQAEREILDSERKLRGVFDTVGAGIVIIEKESMKIIEANNTAVEMAGYKEEEFIGQVSTEVFCPAEKGRCPVRDIGQHVDKVEHIMLCASGEKKEILKTVNQLILKGKEVYVESFIDITEQNIVNKKVREQMEELRRWYNATSDREERVIELKREVNESLKEAGKPKRYENT